MNLPQRITAFVKRNRGKVLRNACLQASVRIWIRFRLWHLTSLFIKPREPNAWVFMGGCYNSGTTIMREMIGAHPDVASLPREGVEMTDAFPDLEAGGWVRMWYRNAGAADLSGHDPKVIARSAKRDWSLWWRKGAKVFLEKSIVHGAWMPTLNIGFPNARFIGVIRNGYCVCEGIRRRAKPIGAAREFLGRDEYHIEEVGRQWNFANEALYRDRNAVNHYLEIRYEEFADDPIATLRKIFIFIGVNPDVAQLASDGAVEVGGRRFHIWNQNEDSLSRLTAEDRAALWGVIGLKMEALGYKEEALDERV